MTSGEAIVRIAARGEGVTATGRHIAGGVPGDTLAPDGTIIAGPNRAMPPCRHFGSCGGCQLQHVGDGALAAYARDRVVGALAAQNVAAGSVRTAMLSPPASRRRAALTAMATGKRAVIGFNAAGSNQIADMQQCPLLDPALFTLIKPLRALVGTHGKQRRAIKVLLQRLDQGVEVVIDGMADNGLGTAMALQDFAGTHQLARLVVDQGDGPQIVWEPEPATVRFGNFAVVPPPHAFLQATAAGEQALIAAVAEAVGDASALADLFAGIGTFALSLHQGRRVYAAEAARDAVLALKGAADRVQARVVTEHRDLFRRPLVPAELDKFDAVVLDPPRAGAEEQVGQLANSKVPRVAYVSCNPASFARDAKLLTGGGYRLDWVQPVGQFRWSTHVELAGCFVRD
ncbi:MAG: class I SAM-dependent RNA methyltransferase [Sphingopyxis sp.]|nr:class I SAM-dependent RNA methyltransferase [Sphingopyxis sp.]